MDVPPGPRGLEVLSFFGRGSPAGTLKFLERTARTYGPISSFRILSKRLYLVDDPDLIQEILVTRQHEFMRDSGASLLRELVGDGLLTREEPEHRERRRVLQPAFHREQIASYADIMATEAIRTATTWQEGQTIDVTAEMKRLTLSVAGIALFGADLRGVADEIARILQRVIQRSRWIAPGFAFLEPFANAYRYIRPHGRSLFFEEERKELERLIDPVIQERQVSGKRDIISLLLNAKEGNDRSLTEQDIRNEIVTFVLAGHETTATALTWACYLFATHPGVQRYLGEELDTVLGNRSPALDDLPRLTYTSWAFQESLRLYPPALVFGRRPKKKITLGGYPVSRGSSIILSPYVTQRNARNFTHPDTFKPERWRTNSTPKFTYFPFGGGAKMCIGDSFAKLEGVLVLAALCRQWQFDFLASEPPGLAPSVTLRPDRPIMLKVERRRARKEHATIELERSKTI
jgi:cytochrome P450